MIPPLGQKFSNKACITRKTTPFRFRQNLYACLILIFLYSSLCRAQSKTDSLEHKHPSSVFYAIRLSTHPLGMLSSRTDNTFQTEAAKKISLAINLSSGNVWLPYVKAYQPMNEEDKTLMRALDWNDRDYFYDQENKPSESIEFQADGVFRFFQIQLNLPLTEKHELKINTRAFTLDEGKVPWSLLTSDRLIEWFHSHISGGEDPFARRVYGLDQAYMSYVDENGKSLEVIKGQLSWSGFDLAYTHYPGFKGLQKHQIYTNFGMQLGVNVSQFNPSLDLGFNASLVKNIAFNNSQQLRLGVGLSSFHQHLVRFGDGVQLRNKHSLLSSELLVNYIIPGKRNGYFSLALSYYIQSSYNKKRDFETLVLTGDRIVSHWHYSISHLYKVLSANYLIFSYAKGAVAYSVYIREDFSVDNAPDAQVGIGIKISFK